jgi:type IV pilus assembly protein PilY1
MNTKRSFSKLFGSTWVKLTAGLGMVGGVIAVVATLPAAQGDYNLSQSPLYLAQSQPPLMMMVMSRDEQLFNKAYSDYTDLDPEANDGIDTTYKNSFEYAGYFDSTFCYNYSGGVFKAVGKATGTPARYCGSSTGRWSGNFLNWATMSRLDILRQVLYGGQRSVDSTTQTILERASIPNDLHAWVKVYSGSDLSQLTPYSGTYSFCNATIASGGAPLMRAASGNWSEWAATASYQCGKGRSGEGSADTPTQTTDFNVRVEVCDPAANASDRRESFCQKYSNGTTDTYKSVGLLQQYGESGRLRFGLISGTYSNPRDGGVLRKNIGKLAGNSTGNCTANSGDEINLSTGQFCTGAADNVGSVIQTISNFNLQGWNYSNNWSDCNTYGILNRQGQSGNGNLKDPGTTGSGSYQCSAWGNPLAEMYSEALRYVGDIGNTRAGTYSASGDQAGLPKTVSWADPYRLPAQGGNSYCAACNILVMSSGLPSFDSDNVQSVPHLEGAAAATNRLGDDEGISNKSYMVGRVQETPRWASMNTHEDICTSKSVTQLGLVRGICPDIPSMEGGYQMAGLAYAAATTDLRPGLQDKPDTYKVTAQTYAVALAETLPKFEITLGTGKISLSPLCQANNSGGATAASSGWRSCFLGSVGVGPKTATVNPKHVYGRPLLANGKAGSFSLVWEDSLWGNDHDNDVVTMLTYCIGAACNDSGLNPQNKSTTKDICWRASGGGCAAGTLNVGENEVLVRVENLSAYAGNAMLTGYAVSGSNSDGVQRILLRPGNSNGSVLTSTDTAPTNWTQAQVRRYTLGASSAGVLESPLWYAAKYGGFTDLNGNGKPDPGEWDTREAGSPDNYFLARNPTKLRERLGEIFEKAAGSKAPVSGGAAGARISSNSLTVAASYSVPVDSNDWTGDVVATRVQSDGTDGAQIWSAAAKLDPSARRIYMATAPNSVSGSTNVPVSAAEFTSANVPGNSREQKLAAMGLETVPTWFGTRTVDTLVSYLKGGVVSGLRSRSTIMGDIVNSSPVVVSRNDDYGYGAWATQTDVGWKAPLGTSYKSYLTTKLTGAPPMVYVGANDGMLHAFDATDGAAGGTERFAFIPYGSLSHIAELANPTYAHRYYVDGLITVADAHFDSAWHTVLVGSTGAGGASVAPSASLAGAGSVFGLDVTAPSSFDQTKVLWEISGKNDSDMGFALAKPAIVPIASASGVRFVSVFGNGVNSSSGRPVLFVVDIQTGEVLKKLTPTDAAYAGRNGVMNVAAVALNNGNGVADTIYAGDMQGNLWKYDISSVDPADWNVAFSGTPLFTAEKDGAAQPITGGLEVSSGPGGGVSIFFGTGRYFAVGDNTGGTGLPVQSIYGIVDNRSTAITGGRGSLVGQSLLAATSDSDLEVRGVTSNPVNYVTKRGWYVDLQVIGGEAKGERVIGTPSIQNGKVFFTTFTTAEAQCGAGGGINWLYGLDVLTGAGGLSGLSLTPGGEAVCTGSCGGVSLNNAKNPTSPPVKDSAIFVPPLTPCDPTDPACTIDKQIQGETCTFVLRANGAPPLYMPRPCGRQSWRQVR